MMTDIQIAQATPMKHILEIAQSFGYDVLAQIPLDARLASLCDNGKIEEMDSDYLDVAATVIEHRLGLSE